MAAYAWRGRNARGEAVKGQLDAATENSVATGAIIGGLAGMATCGIEVGLPPCQPRY